MRGGGKPKEIRGLRSIAECWEHFKGEVIPEDEDATAVERARMVFYAGAAFFFDQTMAIGEPSVTEDQGQAHLAALSNELDLFAGELALKVGDKLVARHFKPRRTH